MDRQEKRAGRASLAQPGTEPTSATAASAAAARSRFTGTMTAASPAERLDRYRAAELSGADTLEAWAARTGDADLCGTLLAIAARERAHAALLENRLRALGGEPVSGVPDWLACYNRALLDERASDRDRLASIVAQLADIELALAPFENEIETGDYDPTTRAVLRAIAADERRSLVELRRALAERAEPAERLAPPRLSSHNE